MNHDWLALRLDYLRGLKTPNDQQRLLMLLADKSPRTADDERNLATLIRAEKATARAQKARADAARVVNSAKRAERKARDHELYKSAGLLILAGLVDSKTGKPKWNAGELLGALLELANCEPERTTTAAWKCAGDAALQQGVPGDAVATMLYVDSKFDEFDAIIKAGYPENTERR